MSRFQAASLERTLSTLVELVARQPDTTMEDLAGLVASHPELGGITLGQLLAGLSQPERAVVAVA